MAREPQTSEEYIKQVQRQAEAQETEEVPSHRQIKEKVDNEKKEYREKLKFYSLLLVVLMLCYIGVKAYPLICGNEQDIDY